MIGPNSLAEATLAAYCRAGRFEPNVARATATLKERRDAMEAALREHFPAGARWTTPTGGYFYWVDLPEPFDTGALLTAASERGVPFVKGADFSSAAAAARRCAWLSVRWRRSRSARASPAWATCSPSQREPAAV